MPTRENDGRPGRPLGPQAVASWAHRCNSVLVNQPQTRELAQGAQTCPQCRTEVARELSYCPQCGQFLGQDPVVGRRIEGRYEVVRRLGEGGMGMVYEVQHLRLKKRFAMKFIRRDLAEISDFATRFEREALATSKQKHPNCVAVTDFGHAENGELYLVMEYLEGHSLRDHMGRPMPVTRALSVVRQILLALQHAHGKGVVHRDIKADNVMLLDGPDGGWVAKVLDFGLAVPASAPYDDRITDREVICGTPTYMAPEQLTLRQTDERSDLYAVGVILYYLLTGRPPFEAPNPLQLLNRKATRPAPRLSDVAPEVFSKSLERLVARAIERTPEDRFASADEFLASLSEVQRERGGGLDPASRSATLRHVTRIRGRVGAVLRDWYYCEGDEADPSWRLRLRGLFVTGRGRTVLAGALGLLTSVVLLAVASVALVQRAGDGVSAHTGPGGSVSGTAVHAMDKAKDSSIEGEGLDLDRRLALVRLLISKGACREAGLDVEALLRDRPKFALGHQLLGAAQICQGHVAAALAAYTQAIALDARFRSDTRIIEDVGALLGVKQERDRALEFLSKQVGEPALEVLIGATTSSDRSFRQQAVEAVRKLGAEDRIDMITVLHLDLRQVASCEERAKIIDRLAQIESKRALQVLQDARRERVRSGRRGRRRLKHICVLDELDKAIVKLRRKLKRK